MSDDLWSVLVCAVVTAVLAAFGPVLIARLPEPEPDPDPEPELEAEPDPEPAADPEAEPDPEPELEVEPDPEPAADPEADLDLDPASDPPKILYTELARLPGLWAILGGIGAVVGAAIGYSLSGEPVVAAWVYIAAVGVILGYVDSRTRLLPTAVIAPSYFVVIGLLLVAFAFDRDVGMLVRSALGWLVMGGFYFVLWFVHPRGLGLGDVRLAGVLGLGLGYLGWPEVFLGTYAGFLLGGIIGLTLLTLRIVNRKAKIPFGPYMLLGALVGVVWGPAFADWYAAF